MSTLGFNLFQSLEGIVAALGFLRLTPAKEGLRKGRPVVFNLRCRFRLLEAGLGGSASIIRRQLGLPGCPFTEGDRGRDREEGFWVSA